MRSCTPSRHRRRSSAAGSIRRRARRSPSESTASPRPAGSASCCSVHACPATALATSPTSRCGVTSSHRRGARPAATGEAWADEILQADGVELGDELLLGPARTPITVIGWVEDTAFNGQGGLWDRADTWREVARAEPPRRGTRRGGVPGARRPRRRNRSSRTVVDSINDRSPTESTRSRSPTPIDAIPGVTEQQTTFNQILGVTVVIALVVIALVLRAR